MVEGEHIRYRTTPGGEEALRHMQELENLIPEMTMVEGLAWGGNCRLPGSTRSSESVN